MALTEGQKSQRDISLSRMNRERFFEVLQQEELEVQLPGGIRSQLKVQKKDPKLVIRIRRYGRDGVEAVLEGVRTDEEGDTEPVLAFSGESGAFILSQERPSAAVPTTSARRQVPFWSRSQRRGNTGSRQEQRTFLFYMSVYLRH